VQDVRDCERYQKTFQDCHGTAARTPSRRESSGASPNTRIPSMEARVSELRDSAGGGDPVDLAARDAAPAIHVADYLPHGEVFVRPDAVRLVLACHAGSREDANVPTRSEAQPRAPSRSARSPCRHVSRHSRSDIWHFARPHACSTLWSARPTNPLSPRTSVVPTFRLQKP
jgi:hypothetical protein